MRTTPVVDGQAPPTEGDFGIVAPSKGQRFANLMGAHAPRRPVAAFNGGRIGRGIAQMVESLLNTTLRTMGVADVHGHEALPFPMFHNLHVSQRSGDTVTQFGKAPPITLAAGAIGLAKDLGEQTGITSFAFFRQNPFTYARV